ncbi:UDP-glucose 4-epimerase [Boeremia exigua]|uniref:UDP-glucose 4-epimerase n=1 Tax=Boeremia exigua TaxID=749465 RepID=UPI001E8CE37D|nr:UDP-glucose 4-epimerase [Boeremia exigua]KAH6612974.1 UDP-glucose 4-epimerase [Boeremia exigua]
MWNEESAALIRTMFHKLSVQAMMASQAEHSFQILLLRQNSTVHVTVGCEAQRLYQFEQHSVCNPGSPRSTPSLSGSSTPGSDYDSLLSNSSLLDGGDDQYVLVTGGLGFIGSHTVLELLKSGHNVIIVDDLSNSESDVFDRILRTAQQHYAILGEICPQAYFYRMDYRDMQGMQGLLEKYSWPKSLFPDSRGNIRSKITGVIHFAAYKAVEESIRQPMRYYHNNISGLLYFLDLLEEANIKKFIFSSSAAVYGTQADGSQFLREEHVTHEPETYLDVDGNSRSTEPGYQGITSPYGRTKFFGEAILSDLARSDPDWTIVALRYFNPVGCDSEGLLGEDPKGTPSNLLPVVTKVLKGQLPELSIYGGDWDTFDGTAIRDYIHVSDLANGHTAALTAASMGRVSGFRTFNLGVGKGTTVMEVVHTMEKASQGTINRKVVERRAGDTQASIANADRARSELGWSTSKTLFDACYDTLNHLKLKNGV